MRSFPVSTPRNLTNEIASAGGGKSSGNHLLFSSLTNKYSYVYFIVIVSFEVAIHSKQDLHVGDTAADW